MDNFNEENANKRGSTNGKLTPKQYRNHHFAPKEKVSINNMDYIKLSPMGRDCVILDKSVQIQEEKKDENEGTPKFIKKESN